MTFSQLLECSASQLEAMSDEQLLEFLGPCLADCPPVDIKVYEESEAKIKLEKLEKKLKANEEKKKLKAELKAQQIVTNANNAPDTNVLVVPKKKEKIPAKAALATLNAMMSTLQKAIDAKKEKEKT